MMSKKMGRPRRFKTASVHSGLSLPQAFWDFLDSLGKSRTAGFIVAIESDKHVSRIRRILKRKKNN